MRTIAAILIPISFSGLMIKQLQSRAVYIAATIKIVKHRQVGVVID